MSVVNASNAVTVITLGTPDPDPSPAVSAAREAVADLPVDDPARVAVEALADAVASLMPGV